MASYTLGDAFTRISVDFLNDASKTDFKDEKMHRALTAAIALCVSEYAANGGKRLQRRHTATTAAGVLDMSAVAVSSIGHVAQVSGYELRMRARPQNTASTLSAVVPVAVYYTPQLSPPIVTATTQPLIGDGATEEPGAWNGMAEWICIRAAKTLRVQRGEAPPPGLVMLENEARATVLDSNETPTSLTRDRIGSNRSIYLWSWRPSTREILVAV